MKSKHLKKDKKKMIDKLKDNLASIAALVAAIVAIGGGFVKYGEITTKLSQIEATQGVDLTPVESKITETKSDLIKQIDELKLELESIRLGISKNKSANNDVNTKAQVNEKEIQLLKLQIQEIQIKSKNPLGG
tara:strand:+ start:872 stop:1270 length:399 start_codon:yes stop_codon:yes gene_type:complete